MADLHLVRLRRVVIGDAVGDKLTCLELKLEVYRFSLLNSADGNGVPMVGPNSVVLGLVYSWDSGFGRSPGWNNSVRKDDAGNLSARQDGFRCR
jgi:hypothetical protein